MHYKKIHPFTNPHFWHVISHNHPVACGIQEHIRDWNRCSRSFSLLLLILSSSCGTGTTSRAPDSFHFCKGLQWCMLWKYTASFVPPFSYQCCHNLFYSKVVTMVISRKWNPSRCLIWICSGIVQSASQVDPSHPYSCYILSPQQGRRLWWSSFVCHLTCQPRWLGVLQCNHSEE